MISKFIESRASEILFDLKIRSAPINIEKIAKKLGLHVMPYNLGSNVSGVLYIQNGKGTIGFNPSESPVRKRFTIAHEIGHFVLHKLNNDMFVDNKQFRLMFRDSKSSTGQDKMEQEANAFAAALLMPKDLLVSEIQKLEFDFGQEEDDAISFLASKFEVSLTAMTYRIDNLNLLT